MNSVMTHEATCQKAKSRFNFDNFLLIELLDDLKNRTLQGENTRNQPSIVDCSTYLTEHLEEGVLRC